MEGHTGTEGGEGAVCGEVWEKEQVSHRLDVFSVGAKMRQKCKLYLFLKERRKDGKDWNDARDCVHIGARGKLLFPDDESNGQGVYAPDAE
jgi:hypothetical protein